MRVKLPKGSVPVSDKLTSPKLLSDEMLDQVSGGNVLGAIHQMFVNTLGEIRSGIHHVVTTELREVLGTIPCYPYPAFC